MTPKSRPTLYRAHGLTIASDVPLAELLPAGLERRPDLSIRLDPAAGAAWDRAGRMDEKAGDIVRRIEGQGAALRVDGVGTFWAPDGGEIRITPHDGADPKAMALYTLGSAMGLALMLRGALVLHAAAVLVEGRAVLFLGPSGAGKSTLAAAFAQAGTPTLGDDTVALWPDDSGKVFRVWPAAASFKMWEDALSAGGRSTDGLQHVADRVAKYYLPNAHPAEDRPHEVGRIFLLTTAADGTKPRVVDLDLLEGVQALGDNLYRPYLVRLMDLWQDRFRDICGLAEKARVGRLERPWGHASVGDVIDVVRARSVPR